MKKYLISVDEITFNRIINAITNEITSCRVEAQTAPQYRAGLPEADWSAEDRTTHFNNLRYGYEETLQKFVDNSLVL